MARPESTLNFLFTYIMDNNFPDFNFGVVDNEQLQSIEDDFNGKAITEDTEKLETIEKKEEETPSPSKKVSVQKTEEPEEDDEEEQEEVEDSEESSEEDNDFFASISEGLSKAGIFNLEDEEEIPKTEEEFVAHFQKEIQTGAQQMLNNWLSQFGEEKRDSVFKTIDAIFNKGVDPETYFQSFGKVVTYKSLEDELEGEENEANQEKVVRAYLKMGDLSDEAIERKIKKLKDIGDLESEAVEYLPALIKKEEKALAKKIQQEQEEKEREAEEYNYFRNSAHNVLQKALKEKELDGVPLTPKTANEVFDYATTYKYQTRDGAPLTDLDVWYMNLKQKEENHALLLKLAALAKNNLNLEPVQKKAVTREKESLFRKTKQLHKTQSRQDVKDPGSSNSNFLFS